MKCRGSPLIRNLSGVLDFLTDLFTSLKPLEKIFSPKEYAMFIAVSYADQNKLSGRKNFLKRKKKGYQLITYVSSRATVFDNVKIGENCFVFGEQHSSSPSLSRSEIT